MGRGALFEVNRVMGPGFLEAVYQECLAREFEARQVPYRAVPSLKLEYKGVRLRQIYTPDFICYETIIVELKAVRELAPEHRAQLCDYLRATGLRVGLLVNFGGSGRAAVERMVI
ncbi:GxxExxY protein [Phenylobacterium sp.]|uniref:GxxExxY protein n=1 Tax=Phenylobacterium sp. TaxID=1871053 RepID=UPI0025EB63B3|nr:GxxExxY protein [Phenylobacterium sp.]